MIAAPVLAPVTEQLVSRAGITQTPVLFENFKKLRNFRIGWASCVGAALGIVWDINDPTTQWPPATSDLVLAPTISEVSSDVPPTNKRKYPGAYSQQ